MYKIFNTESIVKLCFASAILVGEICICFLSLKIIPTIIIHLLVLSTIGILVGTAIKNILVRKKIADKIVRNIGPINIIDETSGKVGVLFAHSISELFPYDLETRILDAALKLNKTSKLVNTCKVSNLEPYILVYIKNKGKVTWKWGGKERKARGIAKGHKCEIEWINKNVTTKLLQHEVGHIMLNHTHLKHNTKAHHKIMREAGF